MPNEEKVVDETENFLVSNSDAPKVSEPKDETKNPEVVANTNDENAESNDENISTEESDKPKKKSRAQKRIESLNADRNKAFERIAELEAKLSQKDNVNSEDVDPADYDTFEEYEKALENAKAPKAKSTQIVNNDFIQAKEELLSKFDEEADKYLDFDEKTQNQDLKITDHMVMAFNELDNAVDTVYYFASNPNEAMKVSGMTAIKQAAYVVKKSEELKKAPKKKLTEAPEPIETVGGSGDYTKSDNELSFSEFEKRRNAQTSSKKFW